MKILVVEDDPVAAMVMHWAFSDAGHDVLVIRRAKAAVAEGIEFNPDLLVVDWNLEDVLDGSDVSRAILERCPDARIVVVSGCPEDDILAAFADFPHFIFVTKPCSPDVLVDAIDGKIAKIGPVREIRHESAEPGPFHSARGRCSSNSES